MNEHDAAWDENAFWRRKSASLAAFYSKMDSGVKFPTASGVSSLFVRGAG